jgi:hypothetical protein
MYVVAQDMQLGVPNFEDFIENLNTQNFLLKKGNRSYKLLTTAYGRL